MKRLVNNGTRHSHSKELGGQRLRLTYLFPSLPWDFAPRLGPRSPILQPA